jgi:hypothetical protein
MSSIGSIQFSSAVPPEKAAGCLWWQWQHGNAEHLKQKCKWDSIAKSYRSMAYCFANPIARALQTSLQQLSPWTLDSATAAAAVSASACLIHSDGFGNTHLLHFLLTERVQLVLTQIQYNSAPAVKGLLPGCKYEATMVRRFRKFQQLLLQWRL